ncbi:hypothetical protein IFM89_019609, partial [Coptis chinensis]
MSRSSRRVFNLFCFAKAMYMVLSDVIEDLNVGVGGNDILKNLDVGGDGGSDTEDDQYEYGDRFGLVFGNKKDAGYNSCESDDEDYDYIPIYSDCSDNELDKDIDPIVMDEEVKNLEEEIQDTTSDTCTKTLKKLSMVSYGRIWLGKHHRHTREPRSCWARAHFDWTAKCDQLTNNFSESFNSWILHIRDKPCVHFINQYNLDLLNLMYTRKELSMELLEGDVVPNVLFMIKKREMRYNWYEVRVVSDTEYLVVNTKKGSRYNVDLVKLECSCIEWQLSGVPCVHGIVVIRQTRGDKWARYCSPYFSVEAFRQTYSNYLYPLDNIEEWPEI